VLKGRGWRGLAAEVIERCHAGVAGIAEVVVKSHRRQGGSRRTWHSAGTTRRIVRGLQSGGAWRPCFWGPWNVGLDEEAALNVDAAFDVVVA